MISRHKIGILVHKKLLPMGVLVMHGICGHASQSDIYLLCLHAHGHCETSRRFVDRSSDYMTSAGGHGLWSGRVLEAAAAVARQHLQAGLDQPRPLHRALLQPLPHLQVPPRPRRQGELAIQPGHRHRYLRYCISNSRKSSSRSVSTARNMQI